MYTDMGSDNSKPEPLRDFSGKPFTPKPMTHADIDRIEQGNNRPSTSYMATEPDLLNLSYGPFN